MKNILSILVVLLTLNYSVLGQCTNTSSFGSATASTTAGASVTISGCNYQTEYSTVSGFVAGSSYTLTNSSGGCITVHSGSNSGPVVSFGNAPLTFTAAASGTYYISYNTNCGSCGTATNCGTTTVVTNTGSSGGGGSGCVGGANNSCSTADPFCTGTAYTYCNTTGVTGGGQYNCLYSTPNPMWMYLNIQNSGNIDINIAQYTTGGSPIDVDFALWGPFANIGAACAGIAPSTTIPGSYPSGTLVDCSFSGSATETANIPGAVAGQFYMLLITNYAGSAGYIQFSQSGGAGTTNCSIVAPTCAITSMTATASSCNASNQYTASGTINVSNPPTSGTLTVTNSCGGSQTFNAPFAASINYSIANVNATGAACTVTATFSALPACTATQTYTSPTIPTVNAGPDQTVCIGSAVTLSGTGASTYTWTGGVTNGTAFTPAATSNYTVTGTNAQGCRNTDIVAVTVNPLATANAGPAQSVCAGGSITLAGTIGGAATSSTWSAPTGTFSNAGSLTSTYTPSITTGTVTLTLTTNDPAGPCNAVTSTVVITVNPLPTVNAGSPQTVCAGTAVTLAATGASTYSWNNGVTQGVAFTPAATTTYTVTGTSAAGCTNTSTVTVTVNPIPVVSAGADVSICSGGSTTLTATGATTYSWTPGGMTTAAITVSPAATTTYTVTGTSLGCTSTDAVTVTVAASAAINAGPDVTICPGASTTLTATGGVTYTWNNGLGAGNGFSVSPAVTTTYTVTGTNAGGCIGTDAMTVTISPLPTVVAGPAQTVCAGTAVTLTATGAATYSWNNGVTQGVAFTPAATTTYTVTGTSAAGCTNTSTVTVTVNPIPTVVAGAPQTVCAGTAVTLTATGASTYTWNNGVTQGVAFTPATTTTYTVTGTSAAGCTNTSTVTITVNPLPTVVAGPPQTVCAGTAVTLTATGASTYTWNNGVTQGVPFTPAATTTYTVTGTSAAGCINTSTVTVTVNPLPTVVAGAPQSVCVGGSVTLTATGASTYSWNNGVTQGVAFTPAATTTYTVTGTSAAGCINTSTVTVTVNPLPVISAGPDISVCTGGSVTLSGTGGSVYAWNNGVSNGVPFVPAATTTYTVTGTDINGCVNTDQVLVSVLSSAPINAGPDVALCNGASTTLIATGGVTYTWNNGLGLGNNFVVTPTGTTTYSVTGTDGNGCVGTDAITVTVNPIPTVGAGLDQTVCAGTAVTLSGTGAATYTWDNGATNGVAFVPVSTQTYTVTGTTAAGCTNTDQVLVTVNPIPVVVAGSPQTVCAGTSVTLTATGAATYSWNNGVNQGVAFVPVATTTYTVTGTTLGCTATSTVTITVNPLPIVNAGPDQTICEGPSVTLTATGASTYTWDNGVSNGIAFTPGVGTITYTVIGTTAAGCVGTDQVMVTVNPNPVPVINGPTQYCAGNFATLSTSLPFTTYSWTTGASTPTVNVTIADNPISVTVTNGFGCSATSPVFTVAENSVITANFSQTICQGQSVLIHGVSQSVAGVYSQTYTTASGCDSVANVTLVVNPLPAVNAGVDQAVCTPTQTTLTATGAATYVWNNGITNGVPFTQGVGSTTYTVTGTDANGCVNTDQVVITVNPLPIVNAGLDQAICIGATATLSGAGATAYTWNNGVINNTSFTPAATTTYTVTGTDANGCINTDQVVVTVNPLPIVGAGADQTICIGAAVTLNGSGATIYNWNNGVTNAVSFSPVATNTYTVTGTDANGCVNTDQVLVTVNPLPIVGAGLDQTVCIGASVTLNGSGATSYTWNNGITNATAFVPAVGTLTYTVTGTDANGCINTDQVDVIVNPLPIVGAGLDQTICIGAPVTLNGSGATTYTWNNGVINNTVFNPSITNTYTVTGTDANGCINTDQVLVTVNPLPIVGAGFDVTTCAGGSVTLNGSGAANYTWNNGITNNTPFTPAATTTYTVTGTDVNGCINTDQVVVTVAGLPVIVAGIDQTVCVGTSVTLSGSGGSTYTWDNGVINGTSFIPVVGSLTYTVTGTDAGGCINTDQVVVTVNPLPVVGAGVDQTICIGASVTLNGSGASTYTWNNGVINGAAFNPVLTNTYTVTGTDVNGCINTDQVLVTVNPLPIVGAGVDQTVCAGTAVTLNGSGASIYAWNNGVTNAVAFTPVATATYTVTGTDVNGCINTDQVQVIVNNLPPVNAGIDQVVCEGTSVTLNGSGASTYSWNNSVTNGAAFIPAVGTITYTVTGTDANGCINTDLVDVTVNPLPLTDAGADQIVCIGTAVTLSGNNAATYSWDNGVTNNLAFTPSVGTVTYTVVGTTAFGCVASDQVVVTVNPLPVVFAGNNITICDGQSVTLTGSGAVNYTWNNGVLNGVQFTPTLGTTTYTVTGTSAAGCINTDQVDVLVNPNPVISFNPDITSGCTPVTVNFTNTTPNSSNCVWTISNGTQVTGCGTVPVTFNQGGCYDVTLTTTATNGCTSTFTAYNLICVEDYPIAGFSTDNVEVSTLNTEVDFTNTSLGATTYEWSFGDGSAGSTDIDATHTYPDFESGNYEVTLVAMSPLGCADTAYATINVQEELLFYVPNTFTPDVDNYNPIFQPVFTSGFDPYDYTLLIFNRWGEIIFESHNAAIGWNGTYGSNGEIQMCQDGTYTWKIEFKTKANDERKMVVGHVNLIR
jgi:gliding motility-associated-like protein